MVAMLFLAPYDYFYFGSDTTGDFAV